MAAASSQSMSSYLESPSVVVSGFHPSIAAQWDLFVATDPHATPFHSTAWMRAVGSVFNYENRSLYAQISGKMTGVLPLFLVSNWIVGRCLISSPFADYGGIMAADEASWNALVGRAMEIASEEKADFLELRQKMTIPQPGFYQRDLYVGFDTELAADTDAQLRKLPRDTRYMIRKGQKAGLEIREGLDQLPEFYRLFSLNWRRLGTPVLPCQWLEALTHEFPTEADLVTARLHGRPVAGVFSFVFANTLFPHYCGASPEANAVAANNYIYWELMSRSIEQGVKRFDFGRSKRNTGAYQFKSSWNMEIKTLPYQIATLKMKAPPNFSPANPKFAIASKLWSHMPLQASVWLGPHVVRWFP